ncbi:MAG: 4-phosphopantetheinyl transferase superfamily protein [Herbinix sp.]|jgi:4'-phosphopantetheinyl transferase|nr:4-phosphopantetheinyl transferase superfamily protein [Herbinix sp.]
MVYYYDDISKLNASSMKEVMEVIPIERIQKANKYRRIEDTYLSAMSYAMLQYGLYKELLNISNLELFYNQFGKPYLMDKGIYFNISHCKAGVACGISNDEIGVDIQDVIHVKDDVLKRICSPEEIQYINKSDYPSEAFTKLWTYKESYLKAIGKGITEDLKQIVFSFEDNLVKRDGFILTSIHESNYFITACSSSVEYFTKVSWEEFYDFVMSKKHSN